MLIRPIYYSIEEFYVYTHIMSIFDVRLCVGMFIQEFWPLLRLLILLTLIWWQVSNLSKLSRIVLPWIQRAIGSHFGWNHWSIICLSKVSSWVSNLSKEWIWYAKSGISGPGVWSISPEMTLRSRRTGGRTSKCTPGVHCIPGNWTIRIFLWHAILRPFFIYEL